MALKELEDYHWFPSVLRKYQMEFIGILVSKWRLYVRVADMIGDDLTKHSIHEIEDLCSGSGYPAIFVHNDLAKHGVTTILTDKFPQKVENIKDIYYHPEPNDINQLKISSQKYYTMYNAFHHFESQDQKAMLQKVINNRGQLLIVEIVQPTLLNFILVTLASTFGVLLSLPLIRPFEWKRLFFTYIFPINLLTVLVDGYISIIKSKTKKEYTQWIAAHFDNTEMFTIHEHFSFPTYIITIKVTGNHD
jgi:hypothetical protein